MRTNILSLVLTFLLFVSCKPDKLPFANFLKPLNISSVGFNVKNDMIQVAEKGYLLVGTTADSNLLVVITDENAEQVRAMANYGKGIAHRIMKLDTNQYLVVGESGVNPLAIIIDSEGKERENLPFRNFFVRDVGSIAGVKIMDVAINPNDELVYTGSVKQTIGEERLFLMRTDRAFKKIGGVRTFQKNTIGFSMLIDESGTILVGGKKNNQVLLSTMEANASLKIDDIEISGDLVPEDIAVQLSLDNDKVIINGKVSELLDRFELTTTDRNFNTIQSIDFNNIYGVVGALAINKENRQGRMILPIIKDSQLSIYEIDSEGSVTLNGIGYEIPGALSCFKVLQTEDKGFIFGVSARNPSSGAYEIYLLKTDEVAQIEN